MRRDSCTDNQNYTNPSGIRVPLLVGDDDATLGMRLRTLIMSLRHWPVLLVLLLMLVPGANARTQARPSVFEVELARGVSPAAASFATRAVREATAANATALVIVVSGDGGVLRAAWSLAREIADAEIPVVVWLGPGRIEGGAAGALLLAAADVAAVAPGASAGFALPLAQTPAGFSLQTQQLVRDEVVRELAGWQRERGRNVDWIERAARNGAIIQAEAALEADPPVFDTVVRTREELLTTLANRRVQIASGDTRVLQTLGAPVVPVQASFLESLTQTLAIPTIAFVCFVLGAIALYLELANPGTSVPGVAGAVLVAGALYGFFQADARPIAVLMLAAGLGMAALEHVAPSHGGLTLAGVLLLAGGALYLVDPARAPGLAVAPSVIVGSALALGLAALGLLAVATRTRVRRPSTGTEALVGQVAEVRQQLDPEGMVFVGGALWSAWSDQGPFRPGELVEVAGVENLRLYVRRLDGVLESEMKGSL